MNQDKIEISKLGRGHYSVFWGQFEIVMGSKWPITIEIVRKNAHKWVTYRLCNGICVPHRSYETLKSAIDYLQSHISSEKG